MPRSLLPLALALVPPLSGCLLSEEDCGEGFVFEEARCVPLQPPRPFRGGDAALRIDGGALPEPEPEPPPDEWAPFDIALVVDDTRRDSVSQTPSMPGADIDAIEAVEGAPAGGAAFGRGVEVLASMFTDPFRSNSNTDPSAALGRPDGRVASLGPGGGFVFVRLGLERALRRGDVIAVTEGVEPAGREDAYTLYLCTSAEGLQDCRAVGAGGAGVTRLALE